MPSENGIAKTISPDVEMLKRLQAGQINIVFSRQMRDEGYVCANGKHEKHLFFHFTPADPILCRGTDTFQG